jgi:hypothetical protein
MVWRTSNCALVTHQIWRWSQVDSERLPKPSCLNTKNLPRGTTEKSQRCLHSVLNNETYSNMSIILHTLCLCLKAIMTQDHDPTTWHLRPYHTFCHRARNEPNRQPVSAAIPAISRSQWYQNQATPQTLGGLVYETWAWLLAWQATVESDWRVKACKDKGTRLVDVRAHGRLGDMSAREGK